MYFLYNDAILFVQLDQKRVAEEEIMFEWSGIQETDEDQEDGRQR